MKYNLQEHDIEPSGEDLHPSTKADRSSCQDDKQTQPRRSQEAAKTQPRCSQDAAKTQPRYSQDAAKTQLRCWYFMPCKRKRYSAEVLHLKRCIVEGRDPRYTTSSTRCLLPAAMSLSLSGHAVRKRWHANVTCDKARPEQGSL
jgi:hypothetical protein